MTDEELDRQLREAVPYIDDAGFTAKVLRELPAQTAPARLRGLILIATAILASVLAYVLSDGARFLTKFAYQLSETPTTWLLALTLTLGLVLGGLGLVAAIFTNREPDLITR